MSQRPSKRRQLESADVEAFAPDAKVGLLATVTPEGTPHITLITTLSGRLPDTLLWGQFCEGASKRHLRANPRAGFLVMTLERQVWIGRARWLDSVTQRPDLDGFNQRPMFRYNAYFGVHTAHRMALEFVRGPRPLSIPSMVVGGLSAQAVGPVVTKRGAAAALRPWAVGLLGGLQTLAFLCWIDDEGYPSLSSAVGAAPAGNARVVVSAMGQRGVLRELGPDRPVALFALNLQMESVLLRGTLGPFRGPPGLELAPLDIQQVYNTMPPKQGLVWPPQPLEPVRSFE
jgi:hypothetical protein